MHGVTTTTKILRHINAIRCLRLLHDGRALSRADMARELGLTRTTIGYAIGVLEEAHYIVEGDTSPTEGRKGRPGVTVSLNSSGAYFIGVDIGTRVLTALVLDLRMNVVSRIVEPTGPRYRDADYITERLFVLVKRVIDDAQIPKVRIQGLCVSVPGLVTRDGSVINAPFLEWRNYPLRERVVSHYPNDWVVVVCNDAFAFANAEASSLATPDTSSVLLVLMAEGIGGAIIDSGRQLTGAHGYSGEIGHTLITVEGKKDTFEFLAGAKSFSGVFDANHTVAEGVAHVLATANDPKVAKALDSWAEALATGFANAIFFLDPGRIVLGGPMASLFPLVANTVQARLAAKLLPGMESVPFSVATFGPDGAAIGAAATIREAMFALPELDKTTT